MPSADSLPRMPARLAILLSGSGSTYENLADCIAAGTLPAEICLVISSRADAYGLQRAARLGHPTCLAKDPDAVTAALQAHQAEWVAMCGWLRYYDPPQPYHGRVLNVHPSLLPSYGGKGMYGLRVHEAVLAAGEAESGCTVHFVSGAYDSGAVIAQERVPVLPDDTPETLQQRVQAAERSCFPRALTQVITQHVSE